MESWICDRQRQTVGGGPFLRREQLAGHFAQPRAIVGGQAAKEGQARFGSGPFAVVDAYLVERALAPPSVENSDHVALRVLSQMPEKMRAMPAK